MLKRKALQNLEVKEAYDDLSAEFELISSLISMREQSGLTQDEVAAKMGTKAPNISRLESGRSNPSLKTLISMLEHVDLNSTLVSNISNKPTFKR
ncbi:helix-turn-helix domain-containing protein [Photobacterium damselae]|uniref:helix-turn-helix domain-containing protein n=1 Tax=Photobacterium damselae TaxID=38293 RepID=UPI004067D91B